jgi:hypothetical protein
VPIFWNGLSSKIQSRKPAIKRPARHQWHYCSPDYDPMEPVPEQHLPPYASARAHSKDYGAIFAAGMPKHNRNRWVGICTPTMWYHIVVERRGNGRQCWVGDLG